MFGLGLSELIIIIVFMIFMIEALSRIILISKLHDLLMSVQPKMRRIEPSQVWLLFIPIFSAFWCFFILKKVVQSMGFITKPLRFHSIKNEYRLGLSLCIMHSLSLFLYPLLIIPRIIISVLLIRKINEQVELNLSVLRGS